MPGAKNRVRLSPLAWGLAGLLLLSGGCSSIKARDEQKPLLLPGVRKVVVIGFNAAVAEGGRAGWIRDPLSGSFVLAGPVPREAVRDMTEELFQGLVAKGYSLVSPGQARGVYSGLLQSDKDVGSPPSMIVRKVGEAFGADAVLAGYIYRWVEREGADYGATRSASVSFDLYMLRPSDGAVLWKGAFDKTQQPLSENLLDVGTFIKGKARWMSAQKLAEVGLLEVLDQIPAPVEEPSAVEEK